MSAALRFGVDQLLAAPATYLKTAKRIGLLVHAASLTSTGQHSADALLQCQEIQLCRLFSPEHGIRGAAQDMIGVEENDPYIGLPVRSLYGDSIESLWPRVEDLRDLDALVIDLQDIGTRYYTYIYTMAFCMARAKEAGIPVVVCDRPNPLGGVIQEGRVQDRDYLSFVGWYPLPVRHGKTIGELARHFNEVEKIGCELTVVPMSGWDRHRLGVWPDGRWINPSPNMPSLAAALTYSGTCLIEGTNLSEGRGTTRPFEWIGAPFIDSRAWILELEKLNLPGVAFIPWSFMPLFQKWRGQVCHGVQLIIDDLHAFLPYRTGCALIYTAYQLYPQQFKWRTEPYEFVSDRLAIDLLTGSPRFRQRVEAGAAFEKISEEI